MTENKRLKIRKRQKQSIIEMKFQKQMSIEEAFEHQKQKNFNLKQKNQKLTIKCRILYDQLSKDEKNFDSIFTNLNDEIWENDNKIKQLEQQLLFRHSKQMSKLKKKVESFFETIRFDIDLDDLDKIADEIDLILLIMEAFQIKYDELTQENTQIDELVKKIMEPEHISGTAERVKQLEGEAEFYWNQNHQLKESMRDLQKQVAFLKKQFQDYKYIESSKGTGQNSQINKTVQKYRARINELESEKAIKDMQIHKRNKKIAQLQIQAEDNNKKLKIMSEKVQKDKKDQLRWKERYALMEQQKNQRIKLLQLEINRKMGSQNANDSAIYYK